MASLKDTSLVIEHKEESLFTITNSVTGVSAEIDFYDMSESVKMILHCCQEGDKAETALRGLDHLYIEFIESSSDSHPELLGDE